MNTCLERLKDKDIYIDEDPGDDNDDPEHFGLPRRSIIQITLTLKLLLEKSFTSSGIR